MSQINKIEIQILEIDFPKMHEFMFESNLDSKAVTDTTNRFD